MLGTAECYLVGITEVDRFACRKRNGRGGSCGPLLFFTTESVKVGKKLNALKESFQLLFEQSHCDTSHR